MPVCVAVAGLPAAVVSPHTLGGSGSQYGQGTLKCEEVKEQEGKCKKGLTGSLH